MERLPETVPATVIVRTIGRPKLLRSCLESLAACRPRAAEVLVVDQSGAGEVQALVGEYAEAGARAVVSERRGPGLAFNVGFRTAAHDVVFATDDDCTVAPDWVETAWRLMSADPDRMLTGRVLPAGDPEMVPSTTTSTVPRDYGFSSDFSVLYPTNNMVVSRPLVLELGGFDERIVPAAEDKDFCYRWLKAGHRLRYEPSLVVWHHAWRTRKELERLYVAYAVGEGMFYAKHLLQGDWRIARFLRFHVMLGLRGTAARLFHKRPRATDWRQGVLRGVPIGLARGLWTFGRRSGM